MEKNARAFTLIELLVVMAIIAILSGLLFGALQSGLNSVNKSVCLSNLRQVYMAFQYYAMDFNDFYPDAPKIPTPPTLGHPTPPDPNAFPQIVDPVVLGGYVSNLDLFVCPRDPQDDATNWNAWRNTFGSYSWRSYFRVDLDIDPGQEVYFLRARQQTSVARPSAIAQGGDYQPDWHTTDQINLFYADGHSASISEGEWEANILLNVTQ